MSGFANIKQNFKDLTVWIPVKDGFNEPSFPLAKTIKGYWIDEVKDKDENGSVLDYCSIIYLNEDVPVDSRVFNGVSEADDPMTVETVRVLRKAQLTDIRQNYVMTKVWGNV